MKWIECLEIPCGMMIKKAMTEKVTSCGRNLGA